MNTAMSPELHSPTVTDLNTVNMYNKKVKKYTFVCLTYHQMSMLIDKTIHDPYLIEINIPSQFKEGSLFVTFHRLSFITGLLKQKKESHE